MIRPRLRPTVSRRNKYLTIAPRAERKLYRESRKGEHNLRRLVGHANFLDTLVDSLDPQSDEEEEADEPAVTTATHDSQAREPADRETSDDESIASSEEEEDWSDDSDDDAHALVRTPSLVNLALAAKAETAAAIVSSGDDYFSRTMPAVHGEADLQQQKRDGVVVSDVEVTSSLSDLMEELGCGKVSNKEREGVVMEDGAAAASGRGS